MLLLRGIMGEQYAKRIRNGVVGFRDLLSTLIDPVNTGYAYSSFDEKRLKKIIYDAMRDPDYEKFISLEDAKRLRMILNPVVPFCYATYFHVVNKDTASWIESFGEEARFIFIEPKIDKLSNNMLGKHLLGRKMKYVPNIREYSPNDFVLETTGALCMYEEDLVESPPVDEVATYAGAMYHILYGLFTRETDKFYTHFENEFRILYKIPTIINKEGLYHSPEPRWLRMKINGIDYYGQNAFFRCPDGSDSIDTYLHTDSPIVSNPFTTLLTEVKKGYKFDIVPEFREVDISKSVLSYGYIGDKDDCLQFIEDLGKDRTTNMMHAAYSS